MKKLLITLAACLACVQAHAATSPLVESLLEYQAITNALGGIDPQLAVIPADEFIIDIRRITHDVAVLGKVKYEIVTRVPSHDDEAMVGEEMLKSGSHSHSHHHHTHTYIAKLFVELNPGIGPNIVTVTSIKRVHD